MKRLMRWAGPFLLCLGMGGGNALGADSAEQRMSELRQRVNGGDDSALLEFAGLPAAVAIPTVSNVLRNSPKDSPRYQNARQAMRQNPGTTDYFRERLAQAAARNGVDEDAFEILTMLATPDAPALVAPYLFNFVAHEGAGDELAKVNAISAALSLGGMRLADAPTDKQPGIYKGAEILAWQKWAIRKGLVPLSTQPNVPQWMLNLDGATPSPTVESPSGTNTLTLATAPPRQPNAAQVSTSTPTVGESPVPVLERKAPVWPWVVGIAVLMMIAQIVRMRRKCANDVPVRK